MLSWLITYTLEELFVSFLTARYDDHYHMTSQMNSLMPFDEEILKEIGIAKPGHSRRLLAALYKDTDRKY